MEREDMGAVWNLNGVPYREFRVLAAFTKRTEVMASSGVSSHTGQESFSF